MGTERFSGSRKLAWINLLLVFQNLKIALGISLSRVFGICEIFGRIWKIKKKLFFLGPHEYSCQSWHFAGGKSQTSSFILVSFHFFSRLNNLYFLLNFSFPVIEFSWVPELMTVIHGSLNWPGNEFWEGVPDRGGGENEGPEHPWRDSQRTQGYSLFDAHSLVDVLFPRVSTILVIMWPIVKEIHYSFHFMWIRNQNMSESKSS